MATMLSIRAVTMSSESQRVAAAPSASASAVSARLRPASRAIERHCSARIAPPPPAASAAAWAWMSRAIRWRRRKRLQSPISATSTPIAAAMPSDDSHPPATAANVAAPTVAGP